ncbi:hypothetical protein ACGFMM_24330 [Streptomyces sp. NPDC048604]|uniref:hypothetical protein n=1 Tax=Streptomyces sp. NPDC048604 TaxID=3365578 RepID=UPI0037235B5A
MDRKRMAAATALTLVTSVVFGWSVVMAVTGHAALIAVAAPVLGLTVTQVLHGARPQTPPTVGQRAAAANDKEDDAP